MVSSTHIIRKMFQKLGVTRANGSTIGNDNMTADPETGTEDGKITVDIEGTTYAIPLYAE